MKWVNFVLLFLLDGKIIELTNLNAFVVRNYLKAVKKNSIVSDLSEVAKKFSDNPVETRKAPVKKQTDRIT